MDFGETTFIPMEEGARLLAAIDDSWVYEIDPSPVMPYAGQPLERPDGRPDMSDTYASEWVRDSSTDLHPAVRPFVINSVVNYDSSPPDKNALVERCSEVLTQLTQHEGRQDCQMETASLDSLDNPRKRTGSQQITAL